MNDLDQHFEKAAAGPSEAMPTGTLREIATELLRRAQERDKRMERTALEAEAEGDHDGCWFAMASRAENQRFIERLEAELRT